MRSSELIDRVPDQSSCKRFSGFVGVSVSISVRPKVLQQFLCCLIQVFAVLLLILAGINRFSDY
jgi:hypothetical protein